jgi:hypothetical protein
MAQAHPQLDIDGGIRALAAAKRRLSKPSGNRASEIGAPNECLRKLVYARTHWDQRALPDEGLQGIFETGNEVEQIVSRNLIALGQQDGFRLVETQKPLAWDVYDIVCHPDGFLADPQTGKYISGLEVKSVGYRYPSLRDIDSLMAWPISAKWYGQCQVGLLTANAAPLNMDLEWWLLLLVNKVNLFDTRSIWIPFDYEFAEKLVKRAEAVNRHVADKTLPDKTTDHRLCGRCPFAHVCMPDIETPGNTCIIDNADVTDALVRMKELTPQADEYAAMERIVTQAVKATLPECKPEEVGEIRFVQIGETVIQYVGQKRTSKPSQGITTFFWRKQSTQ